MSQFNFRHKQIEQWRKENLRKHREMVATILEVAVASVTAKLQGRGCTLDHEGTARRWVFNKHGELIATRTKDSALKHEWVPGTRDRVDTA
jgi:hypothetical protein